MDPSGPDEARKAISDLQELLAQFQGQLQHEPEDILEHSRDLPSPRDDAGDESLALDDAENPLQLLARASDLQLSPVGVRRAPKTSPAVALPPIPPQESAAPGPFDAKAFFVPARAHLDVGPDLDPVDLGLVTFDEAESLFSLFVDSSEQMCSCDAILTNDM